nr:DUF3135 domain-containing protein [Desulfuromonadales bacterium]
MLDDGRKKATPIYDELRALYERSPEEFERRRRELIDEAIERFPPSRRQRALGWQFRLETALRHYRDPVARMNKMIEILWGQVETLRQALNGELPGQDPAEPRRRNGKVLPFQNTRH